jgi:hypothetical protein
MVEEISTRVGSTRAAPEGTRRRPRWWLIAKTENGRVEFLTTAREEDGGETLPVFGYEEEAEMFLHLGGYGDDGWSARESSIGEIVSVLCGPCSGAEGVSLDPLPGMVGDGTLCLVRMRREIFLGRILGHPRYNSANRKSTLGRMS